MNSDKNLYPDESFYNDRRRSKRLLSQNVTEKWKSHSLPKSSESNKAENDEEISERKKQKIDNASKNNPLYAFNGEPLTSEELHLLWLKFQRDRHFRYVPSQPEQQKGTAKKKTSTKKKKRGKSNFNKEDITVQENIPHASLTSASTNTPIRSSSPDRNRLPFQYDNFKNWNGSSMYQNPALNHMLVNIDLTLDKKNFSLPPLQQHKITPNLNLFEQKSNIPNDNVKCKSFVQGEDQHGRLNTANFPCSTPLISTSQDQNDKQFQFNCYKNWNGSSMYQNSPLNHLLVNKDFYRKNFSLPFLQQKPNSSTFEQRPKESTNSVTCASFGQSEDQSEVFNAANTLGCHYLTEDSGNEHVNNFPSMQTKQSNVGNFTSSYETYENYTSSPQEHCNIHDCLSQTGNNASLFQGRQMCLENLNSLQNQNPYGHLSNNWYNASTKNVIGTQNYFPGIPHLNYTLGSDAIQTTCNNTMQNQHHPSLSSRNNSQKSSNSYTNWSPLICEYNSMKHAVPPNSSDCSTYTEPRSLVTSTSYQPENNFNDRDTLFAINNKTEMPISSGFISSVTKTGTYNEPEEDTWTDEKEDNELRCHSNYHFNKDSCATISSNTSCDEKLAAYNSCMTLFSV